MPNTHEGYFQELTERFGRGWNRFWYAPSDPYPLCVMRVCVGLLALYFQLTYTPDLLRFFGADGLFSASLTEQWNGGSEGFNPGAWSYLTYVQSPNGLYAAHFAGTLVLVLMTVGFLSRITTIAGLAVVLAYIHRGPMLTSQFETILPMLMLYLCLGPSGAALSVDRCLALWRTSQNPVARKSLDRRYFSATVAIRLIQVNLALVYLMMGLAKVRGPSTITSDTGFMWTDPWGAGTATWLMIARPYSSWINLRGLQQWPYLLNAWTHAIVLLELTFPILIWNRLARPLLLGIATLVMGSLALISGIAPFYVAVIVGNLAYCSPDFLRRIMGRHKGAPGDITLPLAAR